MKISVWKKTCLLICCVLVFLTSYGVLMKDIFWDVFLFRNVSIKQELTYEFAPSAEVFVPVLFEEKNLCFEKPETNTGTVEIWTRYHIGKKQVILSSPGAMFVDLSRTRLYRTDDSEKKLLEKDEVVRFLTDLAEKHFLFSADSFVRKQVMLDRDFYNVYYLNGEIAGEIYTYSFLGREEEHRMPAISADETTLKREVYRKSFSVKALLIAVCATVLVAFGGFALAGKLSNRKCLMFTVVIAVVSIGLSVVSILLRR